MRKFLAAMVAALTTASVLSGCAGAPGSGEKRPPGAAVVIVSGGDAVSPFTTPDQACATGLAAGNTDTFYVAKLQTARFYFAKLFPETATAMRTARTGARVLMDTDAVFA